MDTNIDATHDWSPVVEEWPEAELRFVMRGDERVLQQRWTRIERSPFFTTPAFVALEWRDVPLVEED